MFSVEGDRSSSARTATQRVVIDHVYKKHDQNHLSVLCSRIDPGGLMALARPHKQLASVIFNRSYI